MDADAASVRRPVHGPHDVEDLLVLALVSLGTVLSFLLFGLATGYYTRSDGETDSVFASACLRRFQARGGGSPASEERKFAGVRGVRSATRRLAEGNG